MAATTRVVDLSNVKEGGNFRPRRKPEGDYRAKIVKVDDHQPKDKSKPQGWVYTIQVDGDARSTYPFYVNPSPKEAWKIRQICEAAGIKLKLGKIKYDPNRVVGKAVGIALADDEYEGRVKSTIDDIFPVSEVGANADEDAPEDDVDAVDDEVETPDIEDDEEEDEPEPEPKPKRRKKKPAPEPEPEDDDEDEDEEEPPPPPKKKAKAKKAAPPPPADDEDDEDLDLDDLDDE
jgi:hypothetical protein